jgi:hypothetical protein
MIKNITKKDVLLDFKASGLTEADYKKAKIKTLSTKAMVEQALKIDKGIYSFENGGYLIPYFNIDGSINPKCYNVRLYPLPAVRISDNSMKKYLKPRGVENSAYLPPYIDWLKVSQDTTQPIYITEGEKKAYCGAKNGFNMLALAGVNSFKNWYEMELLPILKEFKWIGRKVVIVYDSDVMVKNEVKEAITQLSAYLLYNGARPIVKTIPYIANAETKDGVDDYIVKHGKKKFAELPEIEMSYSKSLFQLNKEFCFIEQLNQIYKPDSRAIFQAPSLRNYTHLRDATPLPAGRPEKIAVYWPHWLGKTTYTSFTFEPTTLERRVDNKYNTWNGLKIKAKAGDVKPFLDMVDHLLSSESKQDKKWFLQWCAYPLQHLGTKLFTGVLLHGGQGTGKSFLGNILRHLYGEYGGRVSNSNITSNYTAWIEEKLFIQGDEVNGSNNREHDNKFKDYITGADIEVNKKYVPQYTIKNFANFYFTSNNFDAFYIEPKERRFFIVEVPKELPKNLMINLDKWQAKGLPALYDYLMKVDLTGFKPMGQAPSNIAKMQMQELTRSEIDEFVHSIVENPATVLTKHNQFKAKDWFDINEIKYLYDPNPQHNKFSITTAKVKKILRKYDFDLVHTVRSNHATVVVYCLNNIAKWRKDLNGSAIRADYESEKIGTVRRFRAK